MSFWNGIKQGDVIVMKANIKKGVNFLINNRLLLNYVFKSIQDVLFLNTKKIEHWIFSVFKLVTSKLLLLL